MNLPENRTATSVTVDLMSLDTAFQDQKIKALIADGYRIATVITASDEGRPIAIFVFEPTSDPVFALKTTERWTKLAVLFMALNAALLAAILTTYLLQP
jgi:hypothetical protein